MSAMEILSDVVMGNFVEIESTVELYNTDPEKETICVSIHKVFPG